MFLACSVVTIRGTRPFSGFLAEPGATPLLPDADADPFAPDLDPMCARYGFSLSLEGPASGVPFLDRLAGGSFAKFDMIKLEVSENARWWIKRYNQLLAMNERQKVGNERCQRLISWMTLQGAQTLNPLFTVFGGRDCNNTCCRPRRSRACI